MMMEKKYIWRLIRCLLFCDRTTTFNSCSDFASPTTTTTFNTIVHCCLFYIIRRILSGGGARLTKTGVGRVAESCCSRILCRKFITSEIKEPGSHWPISLTRKYKYIPGTWYLVKNTWYARAAYHKIGNSVKLGFRRDIIRSLQS